MVRNIGIIAALLFLSSCASIMNGNLQQVSIVSRPDGASVKIYDGNGMVVFDSQTPATAMLKRGMGYFQGASYRVVISKPGYKPKEIMLQPSLDIGWYIVGNLFSGEILGWLIIDPLSGGMWILTPDHVSLDLPADMSMLNSGSGIAVVLEEDIPTTLKPFLVAVDP